MNRWEAINKLYTFRPEIGEGSRYICAVCSHKLKSDRGMYRHIDICHNTEINKLRNEAIGKEKKTKSKKTTKAKRANWSQHIERYLDCPYCSGRISDEEHPVGIYEDSIIECPHCGKEIKLGRCI